MWRGTSTSARCPPTAVDGQLASASDRARGSDADRQPIPHFKIFRYIYTIRDKGITLNDADDDPDESLISLIRLGVNHNVIAKRHRHQRCL